MTVDHSPEVLRRSAMHAALSDPWRLRIVDALILGDSSPSELARALDLSSNLLAHHLRTLEDAGLVTRSRSEGDRRRSYVHLTPGALDDVGAAASLTAPRVVFVCTGNSARSPLAAALWNRASPLPATSGGTHPAAQIAPGAVETARRRGLPLEHSSPRRLDEVLRADDLLVSVCDNAYEELGSQVGLHWSVPDPRRSDAQSAFDETFDALVGRIDTLAAHVAADDSRA